MPCGRPVVNRLELNAEQTATLKAIANSRSEELRRVQRAKAFLGAAAGKSQKEIAAEIGLSVSAVARMLRKEAPLSLDMPARNMAETKKH